MTKVKSISIAKPENGRRFAISDIHGCAKTFKSILKQINLSNQDQLFILGDSINRGPSSSKVLERIIKLKKRGVQVILLKGNHEDIVLRAEKQGKSTLLKTLKAYDSLDLLDGDRINARFKSLLLESYHYVELEHLYLVHAGFDFSKAEPFQDSKSMMYIKEFKPKKLDLNGKQIILGHSPRSVGEILHRIKSKRRKIHIDNGCINYKTVGQGNLICLNIDSMAIVVQENLDKKKSGS